jgi:uncharacterized membrane protein YfcA
MPIYLPIAEIPVDAFLLIVIGCLGGFLAGLFGIGGGFIITPLLIFIGIPPAVSVATSANQIIASSISGFLVHWHRKNVDVLMGSVMLIGGLVGSGAGVAIFSILKKYGQIDLVISLIYVGFLGTIGILMAIESYNANFRKDKKKQPKESSNFILRMIKVKLRTIKLPYVVKFEKSNLEISVFLPIAIGLVAGIMVSIMGIGGGFIMIPAMIYLLRMPINLVVGTSLFQIIFTTSIVTILHASSTKSVDVVLALILIFGGVFGTQLGTIVGGKLKAEKLRGLLAILILSVALLLASDLFVKPASLYKVEVVE